MQICWLYACKLLVLLSFPLDIELCVREGWYALIFCPALSFVACYMGRVREYGWRGCLTVKIRIHVCGVNFF